MIHRLHAGGHVGGWGRRVALSARRHFTHDDGNEAHMENLIDFISGIGLWVVFAGLVAGKAADAVTKGRQAR